MDVKIIIKSPNQQVDDLEVKCNLTWSVAQLKDYLYSAYPTKPVQSQQKIIYSGKVLPDHLLLKEVLAKGSDVHTMHLVCPQSTNSNISTNALPKLDEQANCSGSGLQPPVENPIPTSLQDGGLWHRVLAAQRSQFDRNALYPQEQLPQVSMGTVPMASPYMAYQLAAMQQNYAQFMSQILAQNQPGYVNIAAQNPAAQMPQPVLLEGGRLQNPIPAVPNTNRPQNVEEGEEHDFLESLYVMTRVFVLSMILYFYSTPGKLLLTLSLGFIFCIYRLVTKGQQHPQRTPQNNQHDVPRRQAVENNVNPTPTTGNEEDVQENRPVDESQSEGTVQEITHPVLQNASFSVLTFIKTFFTSLIPEHPLPIDT